MSKVSVISCQAVVAISIAISIQHISFRGNAQQSFKVDMCDGLCKSIKECNSFGKHFLKCLALKTTGLSRNTVYQVGTQGCFPGTEQPKTRQNWTRGHRCPDKGTVKRHKNIDCKKQGYNWKHAGRDKILVKFHKENKTWDEALGICQSEGAILAIPNTKRKERAMMNVFRHSGQEGIIMIGLKDLYKNNTFVWLDGSPSTYKNWHSKQPSHVYRGRDEDCGAYLETSTPYLPSILRLKSYVWNDITCSGHDEGAFLCQCL